LQQKKNEKKVAAIFFEEQEGQGDPTEVKLKLNKVAAKLFTRLKHFTSELSQ
jgi:hypothetical protein